MDKEKIIRELIMYNDRKAAWVMAKSFNANGGAVVNVISESEYTESLILEQDVFHNIRDMQIQKYDELINELIYKLKTAC